MFKVQVGEILQFSELAQQDGDLGIGEKSPPQNSSSMHGPWFRISNDSGSLKSGFFTHQSPCLDVQGS